MVLRSFAAVFVSASLLSATIEPARADAPDNAYNAFLAALSALTTASNAVVPSDRNAGRLSKIRQLVAAKLVASLAAQPMPLRKQSQIASVFCARGLGVLAHRQRSCERE
jgi:hypothetical protein